eukprot:7250834-Alexandrium_andersonii.AAC.1
MSASLVGSEMCIRDRSRHSRQRPCRRPALQAWSRHSRQRACRRPALQAVSYTHLTLPTICSV